MAGNFMNPNSSTAIPIFHDPVYYGYIPTNPSPDLTLLKPIGDMTPQEKTQTLEDFAKRLRDATKEEEENILKNFNLTRDSHHRAMIVAEARGDEFLAEEIIKRDHADNTTAHLNELPTRTAGSPALETSRLGKMLAVLFSLPAEVKQALLRGNFPVLVAGANPVLHRLVPATPPTRTTTPDRTQRPYIYILHLVSSGFDNPTMAKMREIIDYATAYLDKVRISSDGVPMRVISASNYLATAQNLKEVMEIDRAVLHNGKKLFQFALDQRTLDRALRDGKKEVPCLYVTSGEQVRGIQQIIVTMEARLNALERNGWDATSTEPLPSTIASCGWTADAGKRRYQYSSHQGINGKIRIFDAISHHLGYGGLSWQCLFMVWNKYAVPMAEHIGHVLGSTYVCQGGMNGDAAGRSVASRYSVPDGCYQHLEQGLLNKPHWVQSRDGTDIRNTTCLTSIENLPRYFELKDEISDISANVEELEGKLQDLDMEQHEKTLEEASAMFDRNQVTGRLLDDIDELDKQLQELQLARDTMYSVDGVEVFIFEQQENSRRVSSSQTQPAALSQVQVPASSPLRSSGPSSETDRDTILPPIQDSVDPDIFDEDYDVSN